MIKIDILAIHGAFQAILGMRNSYQSRSQSDSNKFITGEKDIELASKLAAAGPSHAKYRRMIVVWMDILAPLYWWKEFDTYKIGTVANSESTMHSIAKKPFDISDFSHEHLLTLNDSAYAKVVPAAIDVDGNESCYSPDYFLAMSCQILNHFRKLYLETKDKTYWWQMIQLLPSSYNQKRTVMLNYEVLANIYQQRKNHKLDEWREFCSVIEELPHAGQMIITKGNNKDD